MIKGIYIVIVIVLISIFLNRIFSFNVLSTEETKDLEMRSTAMNDLLVLAGNENCLAFKEKINLDNIPVDLSLHNIIDVIKLENFIVNFSSTEPTCAKDYKFGYRVKVETLPINISSEKFKTTPKEELNVNIPAMAWEFGSFNFSKDNSLKKKLTMSIPVNVYFDESKILPARMTIMIVDGEMETFINFIEKACSTGKPSQQSMFFSYSTYNEGNSICMDFPSGKSCQKLSCNLPLEFSGIKNPGNYKINVQPSQNSIKVIA